MKKLLFASVAVLALGSAADAFAQAAAGGVSVGGTLNQNTNINGEIENDGANLRIGTQIGHIA